MGAVERQIGRYREQLARLREQAARGGQGSALRDAVDEFGEALQQLSSAAEALASASAELAEARLAAEADTQRRQRDVRERRLAEHEAQEAAARVRAVLDVAQDGIVQIDERGKILVANAAVCHAFGYEAHELLGQSVSILMPSPHREHHGGYLERYLRTGESRLIGVGRDLEGVRKDGSRLPIHLSVGLVEGTPPGFVGVLHDLSGERRLRRQLRDAASAAAVAEEHERRRLAADLHDDVSQLLTLAGIKLGLLSDAAEAAGLGAALGELRELVARAHQHTESLTFQLSPPVLRDVGLVAAAEWLAEDLARDYGLRVQVASEGEPPLSDAERITLFRGLRELLINVARHAEAEEARVTLDRVGNELRVRVEDGGVGFDLQKQLGGFGLVSVRERIEALGGRFEIDSKAGRGTCARMILPLSAFAAG